jgi:uncharacterized protein YdhG (YjbR/CyaY superfamily)
MSYPSVDEYLKAFSGEKLKRLNIMRAIVRGEAPGAEEYFSYGLAGYKLNGKPLVYFGGFAHHVGFYATPQGHGAFSEEFAKYKQGKGSVQFSDDQPLPIDLIRKVVQFRKKQCAA